MKNNNQINIDGNKKCDINVVVNQPDELSLDNINHNYQDVARIEELFTDRLDIGTDILTKKLLPKQLQKDFESSVFLCYFANIKRGLKRQ